MLDWLKAIFRKPQPSGGQAVAGGRVIRAGYDAARTTDDSAPNDESLHNRDNPAGITNGS